MGLPMSTEDPQPEDFDWMACLSNDLESLVTRYTDWGIKPDAVFQFLESWAVNSK